MSVLKGNTNFYTYEVSDILTENLKQFYNYGLVEAGAFTNVTLHNAASGYSYLQKVQDNRYQNGTVYEGLGPSWIWENNISPINDIDIPFQVSGVYVNQIFYPINTSGTYAHYIDYMRGRVIFQSPVAGLIQCEYSMRDVGIYSTDAHQWKYITSQYIENFNNLATFAPSGLSDILKENRIWMPSIFIDVQDRSNYGLQLGGGELANYTVFYHIFSNKAFSNKRIIDILNNQETITFNLFNINNSPISLNFDGTLASGALTFKQLNTKSSPYFFTFGRIMTARGRSIGNLTDVYRGECVQNIQVERTLSTY